MKRVELSLLPPYLLLPAFLGLLLLLLPLGWVDGSRPGAGHRLDVYIAGFFPYGEGVENSETGRGVMPSVKLALDHVNEHSTILRNYRLHMWWNDTECNAAVGVKSFFDMMHSGPHKLMLFGAACTHVTDPIAKASKHWHLTQLSYADTHPMFTKDSFPNFFRVVPSENAFNAPRLALLKEFNWTRIGTIYQNEPRYALPHNHMVADLDAMGTEVVETQSFSNDVEEPLRKLREKDVRIILANFNEYWGRKVFCEAFRSEMFGRSYQWLIMGTYGNEWWAENDTDCSPEEVRAALESTIMVDLLPLATSKEITISGITADEYLAEYNSRRGNEYSRFHGYTYDGIWAVASAIQYVSQRKELSLTHFEYRNSRWEDIFLEALKNTSFEGVTGPVRFYNNERKASFLLKQFQNNEEVKIGEYSSLTNRLDLTLGKPLKWVGRSPPKDRTLRIIEHSQVNITIYVVLASLSCVGIVMASVFLAVNIKFRNQRYIKMSSPHLNNLIIIGCILTYMSVIFLGLDSGLSSVAAFPYICTARAWLLMAGFSLAFGAMFSKTWRVHSIFTDLKLNKKVIKDYQLFIVVGVLLSLDLAIMTTWQIADPFYRETKHIEPSEHPTLEDVIIVQENEYCQSNQMSIFIGIIYAYKGLLLIFGAFLAWETRHVSIPALNDSKHVGMSVYNCVIMCVMGAAIALVLSDRKDAVFILISLFIIFCTTATLCLVFVPKFVELKRNPSGVVDKKCRATLRPMSKNRRDSSACELEQRMKDVKQTNCRFRKVLMEKEAELQALVKRLGPDARAWIGLETCSSEPDVNKETVKIQVKKDYASEGTEFTSIGSLVGSSNDTLDSVGPERRKKKTTVVLPGEEPATTTKPPLSSTTVVNSISKSSLTNTASAPASLPTTVTTAAQTVLSTTATSQAMAAAATTNGVQPATNAKSSVTSNSISACTSVPQDPNKPMFNSDARRESLASSKYSPGHIKDRYEDDRQQYQNITKSNTQLNCSSATSLNHSNNDLNQVCHHTKPSSKPRGEPPNDSTRRVSVQATTSLKGNFVVSQSDLWDTQTLNHAKQHQRHSPRGQSRCPDHSHQQQQQQSQQPPQYSDHERSEASVAASPGPIQRSVSEKNRSKHRHKQKSTTAAACQSETDSEREQRSDYQSYSVCSAAIGSSATMVNSTSHHSAATAVTKGTTANSVSSSRKLSKSQHSHHHSTPNVAPEKKHSMSGGSIGGGGVGERGGSTSGGGGSSHIRHRKKESSQSKPNLYGACSESELLDGDTAILPIFRKLLNEKDSRYRTRNTVGASCPNISIKCDIVEYL
ncbi:gamma-aminobutyric acid type B receptor subunit 2 isoform X1 [Culex quinquefasciatus]|uniref:gamma-aminobutyric acid type B receptor subunit 2 isoform X1 n=1 Tax=Culex quinquefasciatus TaxID=7176 RepID=UPI0018E3E258|nr:gamma-aminobutyric acid type B receptor subunit 2 isoform X1 [Culex quinquefasciatus]XP_038105234.1 gamma-aminobutyric acid type B receptor subunit 2 isoform X1 [Culex quinquefasciatus]XP_038105235.1 gamma-aminobutyric acid type B receptor subunit 2 isoform X1 [Culex quinquefasciatus]